jgi:transcription termination factor Rho
MPRPPKSTEEPQEEDGAPDAKPTRRRPSRSRGAARRRRRVAEEAPSREGAPERPPIPPLPEQEDVPPLPAPGVATDAETAGADADLAPSVPTSAAPPPGAPLEVLDLVRAGELHVSALDRLGDAEVADLAEAVGVKPRARERRSELLYRMLQARGRAAATPTEFVEGLLELHPDGYGFLRSPEHSYTQHPLDVYVAAGLVRRVGLQAGHWVSGKAKRARPSEPLLTLEEVEEVNHEPPDALQRLKPFGDLTVVYPDQRFVLEVSPTDIEMRVIDLFCPLGRGQRALIVAPPRTGKTILLQKLADSIAQNSPNVDIVVLLVDERPEEVTNMRRSVRGEVIASTFDRPPSNHVRVAELAMEKVKRMVEFRRDVVLLLDSITRLGRAYNNLAGQSGRILTGGLDAKALTRPKRFFSAARNVEEGGSLTIVATALVDTGSRLDDVIFEEFKGTGNMEIVLDRGMANARVWPAIHLPKSGTRNEDLLLHPEELRRVNLLRKAMAGVDPNSVMESMRDTMAQYKTNAELLMSLK